MLLDLEYYKLRFPNTSKTIPEIGKNISLVLLNDHYVISSPKPYLPNMIEVTGVHIPEDIEILPPHIMTMLNARAPSLYLRGHKKHFPEEVMQEILHQFGILKQVIIWNTIEYPSPFGHIRSNVYQLIPPCHSRTSELQTLSISRLLF